MLPGGHSEVCAAANHHGVAKPSFLASQRLGLSGTTTPHHHMDSLYLVKVGAESWPRLASSHGATSICLFTYTPTLEAQTCLSS